MNWNLDKSRPVCPQICEQLCAHIAAGKFTPGERLLSVREVAVAAGVNPNTVQRAFEQLEHNGVLYSVRGAGWFVSADIGAAMDMRRSLAETAVTEFFAKMAALGIEAEETKSIVKEYGSNV